MFADLAFICLVAVAVAVIADASYSSSSTSTALAVIVNMIAAASIGYIVYYSVVGMICIPVLTVSICLVVCRARVRTTATKSDAAVGRSRYLPPAVAPARASPSRPRHSPLVDVINNMTHLFSLFTG